MLSSPFKLLEPYGPDDKEVFFGRDAEIYSLNNLLRQTRLVLLYGASGTGKTSLINAGLPKVFEVSDWYRITIKRRDNINESLSDALSKIAGCAKGEKDIITLIQEVYKRNWIPIHLVFDQFEELFTLGKSQDNSEQLRFFKTIHDILNADLQCKIIIVMREEYIGHLYDYEPLVPSLFDRRFRVEPMHDETVRTVVSRMLKQYGIELEDDELIPKMILEQVKMGIQAAHLPYLQIYLHYVYEDAVKRHNAPYFSVDGINAVGKLDNVLKDFILSKLNDAQDYLRKEGAPADFARQLLDEFATDEGTKRSRKPEELIKALKADPELIDEALRYFSDVAKLLRADEGDVGRYEPMHDVVAKQIFALRTTENKEFKAFVHQLQSDYERWKKENRERSSRLLTHNDLVKVEIYLQELEKMDDYQLCWKSYIEQSKENLDYIRNREKWRLILISAIAVIALILGFIAYWNSAKSKKSAEAAITNLKLYKRTELDKQVENAKVFIQSEDFSAAEWSLDSAMRIKRKFFNKVDSITTEIDSVRALIPKK